MVLQYLVFSEKYQLTDFGLKEPIYGTQLFLHYDYFVISDPTLLKPNKFTWPRYFIITMTLSHPQNET